MTRRDYVAIAQAIADLDVPTAHLVSLVDTLCGVFAKDNPLFDARRFVKACGLPD